MSYADQLAKIQEKRAELRALEAAAEREAKAMRPITEAEERRCLELQSRADSAYQAAGRRAPPALAYENPDQFRRRLLDGIKALSPRWSRVDFTSCAEDAVQIAEGQVFADALKNGRTAGLVPGQIRERVTTGHGGHKVIEFDGVDAHFTQAFSRAPRVGVFKTQNEYAAMSRDA
jgi:hypothetical protein